MPGSVIGKLMNLGYAGSVSRSAEAIIDNRTVKSVLNAGNETEPSINFGDPVILNSDNTYSKFGATGTMAAFIGVAVREVKQATDYFATTGAYLPGQPADVLARGDITVVCNVGTPTAGGKVYIRTVANGAIPTGVVGGFEAAADGTNSIEITNARWTTGNIDSNKVAEITLLSRNN
jgi:hypothetical protein